MTHPAGVLGYGTGLPSGGSDTPKGLGACFFTVKTQMRLWSLVILNSWQEQGKDTQPMSSVS